MKRDSWLRGDKITDSIGLAAWLVGSIVVATSLPATAAVFGPDDRQPLPGHLKWLDGSVGLVTSEVERTLCTGFCVGRRTVATAAHCLFRTAGERRSNLASFRFIVGAAGNRRLTAITGSTNGTVAQHVMAGSTELRVTPPIDATLDWALMRLAKPVCDGRSLTVDKVAPLRVNRLAARGRLWNVGFHGDLKNWRLTASSNCDVTTRMPAPARKQMARDFSDISTLVLHECDTGLASSGSPVLAIGRDDRVRVVAINVGTYQQTRYLVTRGSVTRRFKPATVANTAVAGAAFADQILAFTRADILAAPASMRQLQGALRRGGFNPGPADGIYGPRTRSAVVAFERATGRPTTGLATRQVLRAAERFRPRP